MSLHAKRNLSNMHCTVLCSTHPVFCIQYGMFMQWISNTDAIHWYTTRLDWRKTLTSFSKEFLKPTAVAIKLNTKIDDFIVCFVYTAVVVLMVTIINDINSIN